MSDCSCDCPCVSPRCWWRFPGSLLRTGRLLVVCSIWACLVSHPPLPPQCPELSRLNLPAALENSCHGHCTCQVGAMALPCLHRPWHLLFCGARIPWEEGKWDGAGWCHLALASPCPQVTLALSPRCATAAPGASHRAGTPHCTQITSALEP